MWKTLLLSFLLFGAFACKKGDSFADLENTCSVQNPVQDLPWLREGIQALEKQDSSYFYVQQAQYNGQTVFIFGNCCPNCNTVVPVYNCAGKIICTLGNTQQCRNFQTEAKNVQLIGSAKKLLCAERLVSSL